MSILTKKQQDHVDVGCGLDGVAAALETGFADIQTDVVLNQHFIKREILLSTDVDTDATDTFTSASLVLPANHIVHGILIKAAAPSGTAGGAKTVNIAVGSVAVADADLTDATDIDVLVASGAKTDVFVHGDAASDHVGAYFPMDFHGRYVATDTTVHVNMLGQSATATATPGTVELALEVFLLVTKLAQ